MVYENVKTRNTKTSRSEWVCHFSLYPSNVKQGWNVIVTVNDLEVLRVIILEEYMLQDNTILFLPLNKKDLKWNNPHFRY